MAGPIEDDPAMTRSARTASVTEFAPDVLRQYALLADGERGILVGPRGEFAWMCAPQWDSDAVFSSLVGGEGLYAVTPSEPRFVWGCLLYTSRCV